MKINNRRLLSTVLVLMFVAMFSSSAVAERSDEKTADALIYTGSGCFGGITVQTDGTNSVTFKVYDGVTASGSVVDTEWIVPSSSTNRSAVRGFEINPCVVRFNKGLYVDITTSGTVKYTVFFSAE